MKSDYEWDWAGGEKGFKEALRLNPSYETAYRYYGGLLLVTGRHEQGIAAQKRSLELDPTSLLNNSGLGQTLYRVRRYDEAADQLGKTLEMDMNYFPTHRWLALVYIKKSMDQQAIQEARKSAMLSNNSTDAMAALAISYAASGNTKEAAIILRSLEAASKSRYISGSELAAIFASLNETDQAFKSLQKAYDEHDYGLPFIRVDPRFDSLRSNPRYADLLRRMGLPQ